MPADTNESIHAVPMKVSDFQFSVPASRETKYIDNDVLMQTPQFTVPTKEVPALGFRATTNTPSVCEPTDLPPKFAAQSNNKRHVRFKNPLVDAEWPMSGLPNGEAQRSYMAQEDIRRALPSKVLGHATFQSGVEKSALSPADDQGALDEALKKIDKLGHGIDNHDFETRLRILHTLRFNQLSLEQHAVGVFIKARGEIASLRAELERLRDKMALANSAGRV